jgi:hypothetical protein
VSVNDTWDADKANHVHKNSAGGRVGIDGVDGCKDKLLLQVRQLVEIILTFADFDGGITRDNAGTSARRIEEDSVKATNNLGELATIIVCDNGIVTSQSKQRPLGATKSQQNGLRKK